MIGKILVVEDEPVLRETLAYNLSKNGYRVESAKDGKAAIDAARGDHFDLILLDIMLPVMDGFEVCRILRQEMTVPILMLTARDDEIDRVLGLEIGADDYLTKPFSMRELQARVKALIRRVQMDHAEAQMDAPPKLTRLDFGDLKIDPGRREVLLREEVLLLKPKEFELLLFLAQNQGRVLSREVIVEQVWDWKYDVGSRTVDVHIRWLREKIEPDPSKPTRIITIRGVGYRFDG
jgi:DNA-binding response OmpR family regulator